MYTHKGKASASSVTTITDRKRLLVYNARTTKQGGMIRASRGERGVKMMKKTKLMPFALFRIKVLMVSRPPYLMASMMAL